MTVPGAVAASVTEDLGDERSAERGELRLVVAVAFPQAEVVGEQGERFVADGGEREAADAVVEEPDSPVLPSEPEGVLGQLRVGDALVDPTMNRWTIHHSVSATVGSSARCAVSPERTVASDGCQAERTFDERTQPASSRPAARRWSSRMTTRPLVAVSMRSVASRSASNGA